MTRRASGHSLVEVSVAIVLAALVVLAFSVTRFGPAWVGTGSTTVATGLAGPIEQQFARLVREVQTGTRVFYPRAGRGSADGLGIVNIEGRAVLYAFEKGEKGAAGTIRRLDLCELRQSRRHDPVPFLERVIRFKANVAPASAGREPALVDVTAAVEIEDRAAGTRKVVDLATSVFLRNREDHVPDDVFPAGCPLVEPPAQ